MKTITARDFAKGFSKHAADLKPGQVMGIIKHGQPLGTFTKVGPRRRLSRNFLADLKNAPYPDSVGNELARRILHDTVL